MSEQEMGVRMFLKPKEKRSLFLLRKRGGERAVCEEAGRWLVKVLRQVACWRKSHGPERVSEKKHPVWENPWPSAQGRLPW